MQWVQIPGFVFLLRGLRSFSAIVRPGGRRDAQSEKLNNIILYKLRHTPAFLAASGEGMGN